MMAKQPCRRQNKQNLFNGILRTEQFSCVNTKLFQMVPEVNILEKTCTQSQKTVFCGIWQEAKKESFSNPFSFGSVPFDSARLHWNQMELFLQ